MSQVLDIAIVGAGMMGQIHARAWSASGQGRIAVVVDVDLAAARSLAAEYDALASSDISVARQVDVASICTPPVEHPGAVDVLAPAGVHLLIEKPSAISLNAHDAMARVVASAGVKAMVGTTSRFYPEARAAKAWLEEQRVPILAMQERVRLDDSGLPSWYLDPGIAGGGVLLTNGIHAVDRMLWLTNSKGARVVDVLVEPEAKRERLASLTLRVDGKIPAQILFVWQNDVPSASSLEVITKDSTLRLDAWSSFRAFGRDAVERVGYRPEADFAERTQVGIAEQVKALTNAIFDDEVPVSSLDEHRRALAVVADAYDMAERSNTHAA